MKFLANMGISPRTVEWLKSQGYDAIRLNEEGLQRLPDEEVLNKAIAENRIILTMDLGFGSLLATSARQAPSVVIFRLSDERSEAVNQRLNQVLQEHKTALETGAIISVSDEMIRVRLLPL